MIIVLIHWRIKDTDRDEEVFLQYWEKVAEIADKTELVGEFLSKPIPQSEFPKYRVDDLSVGHSKVKCRHFINVGIWGNRESFEAQIGDKFNDDRAPLDFEAERRTRTVLDPRQWRVGKASLPEFGSCE